MNEEDRGGNGAKTQVLEEVIEETIEVAIGAAIEAAMEATEAIETMAEWTLQIPIILIKYK